MTLIRHELCRAWKTLLIWTLALGSFLVVCLAIYPDMKKEMESISAIMSAMGAFSATFGTARNGGFSGMSSVYSPVT